MHGREAVELPSGICAACSANDDIPTVLSEFFPGPMPRRWGRMDLISRLAIAGACLVVRETGIDFKNHMTGFITGTTCGCLDTDIAYFRTISQGQPSPLLFSYTLPNIAPSEAAAFFRFEGPVYSIFHPEDPYNAAFSEAESLLAFLPQLDFMIFGRLDVCPNTAPVVKLNVIEQKSGHESARPAEAS